MTTTALYCRISRDHAGEQAGISRQLDDCRELATRRGWQIVGEFTDNDISAYSGKRRPGYLELLDAVRAGNVDAIVCWHPDRLTRNPRELEDVLSLVESHDISVATCQAGDVDLSTPSGRAVARTLVAWAKHESEHKSQRQRRALVEDAKAGKRHGYTPFGWRSPEEAEIVAEIVSRLLSGASLRSITADLNARKIPTMRGGPWSETQVRQVALRKSNAGLRTHKGEVVATGDWPVLVSLDDQERVTRLLMDPKRRTTRDGAKKHLLTGILVCGRCGGPMRYSMVSQARRPNYRCSAGLHVTGPAQDIEDFVLELVHRRLSAPDGVEVGGPHSGAEKALTGRLALLRGRLDGLAEDYADGTLDKAQVKVAGDRIRAEIIEVEDGLRSLEKRDAALAHRGTNPYALTLEGQRALVRGLMTVTLLPATKRGGASRSFDYTRIMVDWA
jgi:site-specific DNA recombinase